MRTIAVAILLLLTTAALAQQAMLAPEDAIHSIDIPVRLRLRQMTGPETASPVQMVSVVRQGRVIRVSTEYYYKNVEGAWTTERESLSFEASEWEQLLPAIRKVVESR